MGRPRGFDERAVLTTAGRVFVAGGYAGTSIDDLVTALDLHRGSLYSAFGSKRGLFLAALRHHVGERLTPRPGCVDPVSPPPTGADLDLVLVAALERGHHDPEVASLVRQGLALLDRTPGDGRPGEPADHVPHHAIGLLGTRLWQRLLPVTDPGGTDRPTAPPTTEET